MLPTAQYTCPNCGSAELPAATAHVHFETTEVPVKLEHLVFKDGSYELDDDSAAADRAVEDATDRAEGYVDGLSIACPACHQQVEGSALASLVTQEQLEVGTSVEVGAVVATTQRVVRQVHEIHGDTWTDEHGERWHVLDIEHVRTSHIALFESGVAPSPTASAPVVGPLDQPIPGIATQGAAA